MENSKESHKMLREKNFKNFIYYGIFLTASINLFMPFIGKFIYRVGGTDKHIALYKSLPGIIAVFTTLIGIIFINYSRNKKKAMIRFIFASRLIVLVMAAVPFLPKIYQPIALVILVTIRYLPESIGNTAVQSYIGDVFVSNDRAAAISLKNRYSVFAQLTLSLIMFFVLRFLPGDNNTMILFYQCIFVLSFLVAIFEIISFRKLEEEKIDTEVTKDKKSLFEAFKFSKEKSGFYTFIICSLLFHFGWQMGWPLFEIYQLKFLGATESWIIIFGVISSIVMFFGYKFWNKQIHEHGNKKIIAVATSGMALTPVLFALSPNLYVLAGANVITGFFTSGTVTVLLSAMLEEVPEKNRMIYVGIHATLTSITLTFAPFVGKYFYELYSIKTALVICGGFRLLGSVSFYIKNSCESKRKIQKGI